ncbi:MAG: hypothetical protein R2705_11350 [Ilumatobacteraceae bacterium]
MNLPAFAADQGLPDGRSTATTTTCPRSTDELLAAGAVAVTSRELLAVLRRSGTRLSPADVDAEPGADPGPLPGQDHRPRRGHDPLQEWPTRRVRLSGTGRPAIGVVGGDEPVVARPDRDEHDRSRRLLQHPDLAGRLDGVAEPSRVVPLEHAEPGDRALLGVEHDDCDPLGANRSANTTDTSTRSARLVIGS